MPTVPAELITGGLGTVILFVSVKYLLPLLHSKFKSETSRNYIGDGLLKQISEQLNDCYAHRREESARADDFYKLWSQAENKVTLLTYQLEQANEKINALIIRIEQLEKMQ